MTTANGVTIQIHITQPDTKPPDMVMYSAPRPPLLPPCVVLTRPQDWNPTARALLFSQAEIARALRV